MREVSPSEQDNAQQRPQSKVGKRKTEPLFDTPKDEKQDAVQVSNHNQSQDTQKVVSEFQTNTISDYIPLGETGRAERKDSSQTHLDDTPKK